jgi:ApaG protein
VGQQPILAPGDSHEYKSYCVLRSPVGFMEGYYTFIRSSGAEFRVEVPRFHLNGPLVLPASMQDHEFDEETDGPIH